MVQPTVPDPELGPSKPSVGGRSTGTGTSVGDGGAAPRSTSCVDSVFTRTDGKLSKEEANAHRSVTAARTSNFSGVFWHNFTSMVGAGVLGLPFAMGNLTWAGGLFTLFASWLISYGTFIALVLMHEQRGGSDAAPHDDGERGGKGGAGGDGGNNTAAADGDGPLVRMDRYQELTRFAFGRKWGNWSLLPFQLVLFFGIPVAYNIVGGESIAKVIDLLAPEGAAVRKAGLSAWLVLFAGVQLAIVQIRSFHHMSWVSAAGAIASLFYVAVAAINSIVEGTNGSVDRASVTYLPPPAPSTWSRFSAIANAIATFAFAWGGHNIACEIQATLPTPPSSVKPMMRSVHATFWLAAVCYGAVSIAGFATFGSAVNPNVLIQMGRGASASTALKAVIAAANLAVVVHVLAGYQVYLFPLIDIIEGVALSHRILPNGAFRLVTRSALVVLIGFVACAIPFFSAILGILGALSVTPTTFMMPCILWLHLGPGGRGRGWWKRPGAARDWTWWAAIIALTLSTLVMVLGALGAVDQFIQGIGTYGSFQ